VALPQIALPGNFPAWLAAGHEDQPQTVYARVPMSTGEARLRRVYTTAPRVRSVSLLLTPSQAAQFHEWFERDLRAGEVAFAAKVRSPSLGEVWWEARFAEAYRADPLPTRNGVVWQISAELLLTGEPSIEPPVLSTLAAEVLVGLSGSAQLTTEIWLAAEVDVTMEGTVSISDLAAEVEVPLWGRVTAVPQLAAEVLVELEGEA